MASIRKRIWKSRGFERSAWVVDYFDRTSGGCRRLKTFATKKEAEQWATTALYEVRQGTHTSASTSLTVAKAMDLWIECCEAEKLEESTLRQRRQHSRLHIKPFLGEAKLAELTAPRIHDFDIQLRTGGRSVAMRRHVLTNLKTMLSFCQRRGLVAQNVAISVRVKDSGREAKGPLRAGVDFPSRAELKALMEQASGRWRPLLVTAIFTGMRASELRGLPWSDVDFDAGVVHVRQRADAWGTIGPPKSKAGKRNIPLAPIVINTLTQWHQQCPKGDLDLVFPNGAGNIESLTNIWKRFWTPLQLACGLIAQQKASAKEAPPTPRYGFHMLRHAAASLFIEHLGWTPKRLQTVMGHSSIRMTFDLYGHLFENTGADRQDMAKVEAAISAA